MKIIVTKENVPLSRLYSSQQCLECGDRFYIVFPEKYKFKFNRAAHLTKICSDRCRKIRKKKKPTPYISKKIMKGGFQWEEFK
jgi:uncharacterized protein YbaA (DUF1428 family)